MLVYILRLFLPFKEITLLRASPSSEAKEPPDDTPLEV